MGASETIANDIGWTKKALNPAPTKNGSFVRMPPNLAKNQQFLTCQADGVLSAVDSGFDDFETEVAELSEDDKALELVGYVAIDTQGQQWPTASATATA